MTDPAPSHVVKQINVRIESTGRVFSVAAPIDLTTDELIEVLAWMANPEGMRESLNRTTPVLETVKARVM